MAAASAFAADCSDGGKPRWITSSLPKPKSPGYIFVSASGSGKSLEEARQKAFVNLTSKLEHERGLTVNSTLTSTETGSRNSGFRVNSEFTIEAVEKGKEINLVCKIIDEYWERSNGRYMVTDLYTVNDLSPRGYGAECDYIRTSTSYGAAPVAYSLIPGVGQFAKGSALKGALILGGSVAVGAGVVAAESMRATYKKKMKEYPKHHDFYNKKADQWGNIRNVAVGVGAGLYLYNLIDAAVAPGRRRVIVTKSRCYNYSLAPAFDGESAGLAFTLNF